MSAPQTARERAQKLVEAYGNCIVEGQRQSFALSLEHAIEAAERSAVERKKE